MRENEQGNITCYTKEEVDALIDNGEDKNSFQEVSTRDEITRCVRLMEEQEFEMEEQIREEAELEYIERMFREEMEREQRRLENYNEWRDMNITQRIKRKFGKIKKNILTGYKLV